MEDRQRFPLTQFPQGVVYSIDLEDGAAVDASRRRVVSVRSSDEGPMLHNPLDFDYELLHGQRVLSIKGCRVRRSKEGSTICDKAVICLERIALVVAVNEDTDEITLHREEDPIVRFQSSDGWNDLEPYSKYVGKELGWCWVGRNYRGYADMFFLSFAGVEPEIAFCGVASSLWLYKMQRI